MNIPRGSGCETSMCIRSHKYHARNHDRIELFAKALDGTKLFQYSIDTASRLSRVGRTSESCEEMVTSTLYPFKIFTSSVRNWEKNNLFKTTCTDFALEKSVIAGINFIIHYWINDTFIVRFSGSSTWIVITEQGAKWGAHFSIDHFLGTTSAKLWHRIP